jgi:hypothetical protein
MKRISNIMKTKKVIITVFLGLLITIVTIVTIISHFNNSVQNQPRNETQEFSASQSKVENFANRYIFSGENPENVIFYQASQNFDLLIYCESYNKCKLISRESEKDISVINLENAIHNSQFISKSFAYSETIRSAFYSSNTKLYKYQFDDKGTYTEKVILEWEILNLGVGGNMCNAVLINEANYRLGFCKSSGVVTSIQGNIYIYDLDGNLIEQYDNNDFGNSNGYTDFATFADYFVFQDKKNSTAFLYDIKKSELREFNSYLGEFTKFEQEKEDLRLYFSAFLGIDNYTNKPKITNRNVNLSSFRIPKKDFEYSPSEVQDIIKNARYKDGDGDTTFLIYKNHLVSIDNKTFSMKFLASWGFDIMISGGGKQCSGEIAYIRQTKEIIFCSTTVDSGVTNYRDAALIYRFNSDSFEELAITNESRWITFEENDSKLYFLGYRDEFRSSIFVEYDPVSKQVLRQEQITPSVGLFLIQNHKNKVLFFEAGVGGGFLRGEMILDTFKYQAVEPTSLSIWDFVK